MKVESVSACQGCPLRGDGSQTFVPVDRVEGAQVLVVGEGRADEATQVRAILKKEGIDRVIFGQSVRCSAELPDFKKKAGLAEAALDFCQRAHPLLCGGGVRLVVTRGDQSLYAATQEKSAADWRGWLLPYRGTGNGWKSQVWTPGFSDVSVLATQYVLLPSVALSNRMDWRKAKRVLTGEWPSRFPGFTVEPPRVWPRVSAFDTEFHPTTRVLERYSLYDGGLQSWVIEAADVQLIEVPENATVIMHNIEADLDHLDRILKGGKVQAEDTMLMHSVLWSDLEHSLAFLGSLYARINRWKHLFYSNPLEYSAGDAIGTWDVYVALAKEMRVDPQSAWIYRHSVFPLIPLIMEAELVGLALDQDRVRQAIGHFDGLQEGLGLQAQAYAGFPLNLGSPEQVGRWLYEVEKVGVKQRGKRGRKDPVKASG